MLTLGRITFLTLVPFLSFPFLVFTSFLLPSSHLIYLICFFLYLFSFPFCSPPPVFTQFPIHLFSLPPATPLSLTYPSVSLLVNTAKNAHSSNIFPYSFSFFTTAEGLLPTSIINSGVCCSLPKSNTEVLFPVS